MLSYRRQESQSQRIFNDRNLTTVTIFVSVVGGDEENTAPTKAYPRIIELEFHHPQRELNLSA